MDVSGGWKCPQLGSIQKCRPTVFPLSTSLPLPLHYSTFEVIFRQARYRCATMALQGIIFTREKLSLGRHFIRCEVASKGKESIPSHRNGDIGPSITNNGAREDRGAERWNCVSPKKDT